MHGPYGLFRSDGGAVSGDEVEEDWLSYSNESPDPCFDDRTHPQHARFCFVCYASCEGNPRQDTLESNPEKKSRSRSHGAVALCVFGRSEPRVLFTKRHDSTINIGS